MGRVFAKHVDLCDDSDFAVCVFGWWGWHVILFGSTVLSWYMTTVKHRITDRRIKKKAISDGNFSDTYVAPYW